MKDRIRIGDIATSLIDDPTVYVGLVGRVTNTIPYGSQWDGNDRPVTAVRVDWENETSCIIKLEDVKLEHPYAVQP